MIQVVNARCSLDGYENKHEIYQKKLRLNPRKMNIGVSNVHGKIVDGCKCINVYEDALRALPRECREPCKTKEK